MGETKSLCAGEIKYSQVVIKELLSTAFTDKEHLLDRISIAWLPGSGGFCESRASNEVKMYALFVFLSVSKKNQIKWLKFIKTNPCFSETY